VGKTSGLHLGAQGVEGSPLAAHRQESIAKRPVSDIGIAFSAAQRRFDCARAHRAVESRIAHLSFPRICETARDDRLVAPNGGEDESFRARERLGSPPNDVLSIR
jgi:hypothetical protein